jgi:hypothetical protein
MTEACDRKHPLQTLKKISCFKHQDPKFKQKLDLDSQAQKARFIRKTCKIVFDWMVPGFSAFT